MTPPSIPEDWRQEFEAAARRPLATRLRYAEHFAVAWERHVDVQGFPVCHIDDIIASKEAANRVRDRESLPRLRAFREWLRSQQLRKVDPHE